MTNLGLEFGGDIGLVIENGLCNVVEFTYRFLYGLEILSKSAFLRRKTIRQMSKTPCAY